MKPNVSFGSKIEFNNMELNKFRLFDCLRFTEESVKEYKDSLIPMLDMFALNSLFDSLTSRRDSSGFWVYSGKGNNVHIPWKMHVYADNEVDWLNLSRSLGKYLKNNDINFKAISSTELFDDLNDSNQKGKAITIYPNSAEQFAQLAHDLNYIIKLNGLEKEGSSIIGDRELGDSGRIFYRYEYNKKMPAGHQLELNKKNYPIYRSLYDANRGEGKYLADGMTQEDDIWFNFNPDVDSKIEI